MLAPGKNPAGIFKEGARNKVKKNQRRKRARVKVFRDMDVYQSKGEFEMIMVCVRFRRSIYDVYCIFYE